MNSSKPLKSCYLALDQGGHATRAILFSQTGENIFHSEALIDTLEKESYFVEHDPDAMLRSFAKVIADVSAYTIQHNIKIEAAGLATQRSSFIATDKDGRPLTNIISWQDRRAYKFFENEQLDTNLIHQKTGLVANAHYGASKMQWCIQNIKQVKSALGQNNLRFAPLASFILNNILVEKPFVVDPANGSRTLLMNLDQRRWDQELFTIFQIPENTLPELKPTRYAFGHIAIASQNVPLTICTGDQNAAVFSHGQPTDQQIFINAGTGAFILSLDKDIKIHPQLLKSVLYDSGTKVLYANEGTVNGAGRALNWLAEKHRISNYENQLAPWIEKCKNPPVFINGISGVGSPYWIPDLTSYFDHEAKIESQFVAVTESIVFLIYANIQLMPQALNPESYILLSGGLANNTVFCQLLADITRLPVTLSQETEATAKGLYYLLSADLKEKIQTRLVENKQYKPLANPDLLQRYESWEAKMKKIKSENSLA
ncbi:MAG: FGGY family carbohydrate kinase [Gammaproteobacteria bacterium]|nr:FGGY family carbohydrate kinase [Gammaproteobacteria bacterium]